MPPFSYQNYVSPYSNTIAELLAHQGDPQAQAAQTIAAANARAGEQVASAYGGMATGLANAFTNTVQTVQREQEIAPKLATEKVNLQELQTGIAEHDAFKKILKDTPPLEENGMQLYDLPTLAAKSVNALVKLPDGTISVGIDPSAYLQKYGEVNNAFRQEYQAKLATIQLGAQSLMQAPDADLALNFLDRLEANKTISAQTHQHFTELITADPSAANIIKVVTPFAGAQKPIMGAKGTTPVNPITGLPMGPALPETVILPRPGAEAVQTGGPNGPRVIATAPPGPQTLSEANLALRPIYAKRARGEPLTPAETDLIAGAEGQIGANDALVPVKTMENGKPVEKVLTRTQALTQGPFPSQPPAAIQVQNLVSSQTPTTPIDASRPDPTTANIPDRLTGLTPNAVYQAGAEWALTGKFPPTGLGASPRSQAVRAIVANKGAAMAAAAGTDIPTLQAEYRGNAAALGKLVPQAQATTNFANTASDNLDLALQSSPKVGRTDSAWVNSMANAFVRGATPAANLTDFETKIYTAAREYAKVTTGGAMSAAGLSDTAAREATKLLNAAQSPAAFAAAVAAMKQDMGNVIAEQASGIGRVSSTLGSFFSRSTGGGGVAPPPGAAPVVWERGPDGKPRIKVGG
jgi:hypothetical protein